MKVQRTDSKTGKDIFCNVPPMLPGDVLSKIDDVSLEYSISIVKSFPLRLFLSRFMAGHHSLKESRLVSRKRLALIGSKVRLVDPQANVLFDQIQRYNQAVDGWKRVFESTLDLSGLIDCNEPTKTLEDLYFTCNLISTGIAAANVWAGIAVGIACYRAYKYDLEVLDNSCQANVEEALETCY